MDYLELAKKASRRLPQSYKDWREDCQQEVYLKLFETKPEDQALAKVIAWRTQEHFWRWLNRWGTLEESLNVQEEQGVDYAEERDDIERLVNRLGALEVLRGIPAKILAIGAKRAIGKALDAKERMTLKRFRERSPEMVSQVREVMYV